MTALDPSRYERHAAANRSIGLIIALYRFDLLLRVIARKLLQFHFMTS